MRERFNRFRDFVGRCGVNSFSLAVVRVWCRLKLHIAAANGYSKVVAFLLEHHANVDAEDRDRWTPVHAAACWGHVSAIESCNALFVGAQMLID